MATASLTGIVQIDADRALDLKDVSVEMTQIVQRSQNFALPDIGKVRTPAEIRAQYKTKEPKLLLSLTQHLAVNDEESFLKVGILVAEAAKAVKDIAAEVAADKKLASDLHTKICDREANAQLPYKLIRQAGDANLNAFRTRQREEERLRIEQEQAEARAKERKLLEEADAQRREAERLELQRLEAEAAALAAKRKGDIATMREQQAQATAATTQAAQVAQQVEILEERALSVVEEVQHAPAVIHKIAGRIEKWPWVGTVENEMELIQAVATGKFEMYHVIKGERVPIIRIENAVVQHYAKALEANARIPGCSFKETLQTAQRTK